MADHKPGMEAVSGVDSFLPNFCSIRMVFAVVITAQLLAIVLTLGTTTTAADFAGELSLRSLFVQWIALCAAALLCLSRPLLRRLGDGLAGLLAWLLVMAVTLLVSGVAVVVLGDWPDSGVPAFIYRSLGIGAIVSALVLRYFYIQHLWRRQVEAESEARFQALQSRIRPHVLFNSMNTIANLTRSAPALAEEVVQDLSDLFRASLSDVRRMSTLGDELELARGYLRIEHQRLGDRLKVEWDLEALPEQAPLPALVLQPLLENAVYHGVEPDSKPGNISITGRYRRHQVNLSIRNSLPTANPGQRRQGNQMALENVRQRLAGFFNQQASLVVGEVDGEHQVRIVFPFPWKP